MKKIPLHKNSTKKKKKLSRSLLTDHLTGLYNRRYFDKFLKEIIVLSKREKHNFSLLMIDVDNFKMINDKYGHLTGDRVLVALAKVLKSSVRRVDVCFRYGGDEITIILPHADRKAAGNIVSRLKTKLDQHKCSTEDGYRVPVQLSLGLAVFPDDGFKPTELIKKADELLYRAKRQKKRKDKGIAEPFILKTKLVPPLLKDIVVTRPRLLSSLQDNVDKKLILVTADAGYGKTTLLAQLIKELNIHYVWYQTDKSDQELDVFIRYLVEGMKELNPTFGKMTMSVIRNTRGREIEHEVLIGTFINELLEVSDKKIVFVFDDLQEVYESKEIIAGLEFLVNHLPPHVTVIISTRSNVPISLTRLRSKNDIVTIDKQDLKFNRDEIRNLCKQIGYKPRVSEIKKLENDSEGWITSLQFLIPATKQREIFTKTRKSLRARLDEYFDKEVYSQLNENLKLFLMATSVLEYLTPEACDFLLDREDSAHILKELEKKHLFISAYDEPTPVYRYHRLFRDFLSKKLNELGLYQKFQNRAGRYWEKEDVFTTAVQHYFNAKNFKLVARFIRKFGEDYITLGKVEFIRHYIEHLPEIIINNSPLLMRLRGRICVWDCDWDNAKYHFSRARQLAQRQKDDLEVFKNIHDLLAIKLKLGEHKWIIRQIIKVLRSKKLKNLKLRVQLLDILGIAFSLKGRMKKSIAVYEEILKKSKKIDDNLTVNTALNNLAVASIRIGNFAEGQNYFEALTNKLRTDPSPLLISTLSNLGMTLVIQGSLVEAKERLEEAQKYARLFNERSQFCVCYQRLGLVKIYSDEVVQAEQLLKKAEKLAMEIGYKFMLSDIWEGMAELAINRGNFLGAKQYIDQAFKIPIPFFFKASHLITKAKLELSLENFNAAKKALDQALPNLKESKDELMKFYFQMTRLYLLRKDEMKARDFLNESIRIAKKNSYDFLFLYELKHCPEVIRFAKKIGVKSLYFQHLLLKLPYSENTQIPVEPEMDKYDFVVQLFGKVKLFKSGKEIKVGAWKTKKFQELFGFFIVSYQTPATREKITSILWPDHSLGTARQLFHNALYQIRKIVGKNIIVFNKEGYTLLSKYRYWIDTQEFEKLIIKADRLIRDDNRVAGLISYEEAASLYRGGFMDDFYSEWCQERRQYFEKIYLDVLKKVSNGHYKIGNFEKALNFCNLLINKNPYNEETYCLTMRCHAALNDLGGVQKCFSDLKENLRKGLKTTPHLSTVKVFNTLMKQR
jgi:LuxR family maltose regulon positive regulatory protein